jgi:hypothetical protein
MPKGHMEELPTSYKTWKRPVCQNEIDKLKIFYGFSFHLNINENSLKERKKKSFALSFLFFFDYLYQDYI